ncbi:MAG: hypothetical protein ABJA02_12180 [Acidobacteriota bacterium]
MKIFRIVALLAGLMAASVVGINAQKRPTKKSTTKKPPSTKTVPPLDVRAAREKVDNQLENVNRFVDKMGPIALAIETLDESNRAKRLPQDAVDKNEANKQKVIAAIRNLKDGLATLESEFRTKPILSKYLPNIQGITDLASKAEDSAIAGKFVESKEPLRGVSGKLTDTLGVMPL